MRRVDWDIKDGITMTNLRQHISNQSSCPGAGVPVGKLLHPSNQTEMNLDAKQTWFLITTQKQLARKEMRLECRHIRLADDG